MKREIEFPTDLDSLVESALSGGPISGLCRRVIRNGIASGEIHPVDVPASLLPSPEELAEIRRLGPGDSPRPAIALGRPHRRRGCKTEPIVPPKRIIRSSRT